MPARRSSGVVQWLPVSLDQLPCRPGAHHGPRPPPRPVAAPRTCPGDGTPRRDPHRPALGRAAAAINPRAGGRPRPGPRHGRGRLRAARRRGMARGTPGHGDVGGRRPRAAGAPPSPAAGRYAPARHVAPAATRRSRPVPLPPPGVGACGPAVPRDGQRRHPRLRRGRWAGASANGARRLPRASPRGPGHTRRPALHHRPRGCPSSSACSPPGAPGGSPSRIPVPRTSGSCYTLQGWSPSPFQSTRRGSWPPRCPTRRRA